MNVDLGNKHQRRGDVPQAVRRDFLRRARREDPSRSFWRGMRVIGMVGWPIAIGALGGAFLGRYLDARFATGVRWTLMLLTAGAMLGSYTAWRALEESMTR